MKKRIPVVLAVLVVACVLVVVLWRSKRNGASADEIRVSGHIEATEVDLGFKVPGRVIRILVDEGDDVGKGDLIAVLDDRELSEQLNSARALLREAESRLAVLKSQIEQQQAATAAQESQARAALEAARAQLQELMAGARPQEIQQAEAEVNAAKAELSRVEEDYRRAAALYRGKIISEQNWQHAKTAYEVARARYRAAVERLRLVREGPRQERIRAARAQVNLAEANLRLAATGWLLVERLEKELQAAEAQVDRAEAAVRLAETQKQETRLVSPMDGVVLVRDAEEGEVVPAGTPIVTLANLDTVWLKAFIQESDLGRVHRGQKVRVQTDSFPGKIYEGTLSYLSDEAEFTPKNVQTRKERVKLVYRIKVDLSNPHRELKPGMPADGLILLHSRIDSRGGRVGRSRRASS